MLRPLFRAGTAAGAGTGMAVAKEKSAVATMAQMLVTFILTVVMWLFGRKDKCDMKLFDWK